MNLRLEIAYDGLPFKGWARQPDQRTVQGELEAALAKMWGRQVATVGAGRTDAGVHALAQVVSVADAPDDLVLVKLRDALNAMCGPAISVVRCAAAPAEFHARFSARSRTYVYSILRSDVPDPWLARTAWWHPEPLNVDMIDEAAGHLLGERDFSSFGRLPDPGAPATRTLYELSCARHGRLLKFKARANAFIHQMVRSLVGTLVRVGEGRIDPDDVPAILGAHDRSAAGPVAPPHGLCLVSVEYDDRWSTPFDPLQ